MPTLSFFFKLFFLFLEKQQPLFFLSRLFFFPFMFYISKTKKNVLEICSLPSVDHALTCSDRELKHGESCKPTCKDMYDISNDTEIICDNGTLTPGSFSCKKVLLLYLLIKNSGKQETKQMVFFSKIFQITCIH